MARAITRARVRLACCRAELLPLAAIMVVLMVVVAAVVVLKEAAGTIAVPRVGGVTEVTVTCAGRPAAVNAIVRAVVSDVAVWFVIAAETVVA